MVVGENGILNRATDASKKTQTASEKEAIEFIMSDIKTELMIGEEIPNEKYIGEKLSEMSSGVEIWRNVIVNKKTYADGWYLLEKENNIPNYGKAKSNWLINYNTGEVIELQDNNYTIATKDTSGAIVDGTLKLNIDPSNLQDKTKWGDGVEFYGIENELGGVKKTEIKFNKENKNYLRMAGINIQKSEGITFEFYGKNYGETVYPFEKTDVTENGVFSKSKQTTFRIGLKPNFLDCCFGKGDCGSEYNDAASARGHWLLFPNLKLNDDYDYFSLTIDFNKNKVNIYDKGVKIYETTCNQEYLENGDIFDNSLPFTVGVQVYGTYPMEGHFSTFDLYSCRLYTRVLTDTEIGLNFTATTNYHNELLK